MEDTDEDVIIIKYRKKHYADLVESGYLLEPFPWTNNYLKPDFYNRIKNLLNWKEMKKSLRRAFLLDPRAQEEIVLVAYHKKERKAIGSITLRRITDRLWCMGSIFVSPSHRGKRIASSLYRASFKLLKEKNVEKVAGIISKSNVASVKSFERSVSEYAFMSNRIFECKRTGSIREDFDQIRIGKARLGEENNLFEIFQACVEKQWCVFLEIDEGNYLDRMHGPGYFEEYKSPLSRFVTKKDVFLAEKGGEVQGYAVSHAVRFFGFDYSFHVFVPISKDFDNVCRALLVQAFRPPSYREKDNFAFLYIGDAKAQGYLKNLGFEVKEILVVSHFL